MINNSIVLENIRFRWKPGSEEENVGTTCVMIGLSSFFSNWR
jgi:hypothetical protein